MQGLPPELIYVLIFGAILLFQYMTKRIAQPAPQPSAPDEEPEELFDAVREIPPLAPPPLASVPTAGQAVPVGHFGRAEAPRASPALARRRFSRRSLMGTRREVQNAIVIAAIVGPCRAFEPHDIR